MSERDDRACVRESSDSGSSSKGKGQKEREKKSNNNGREQRVHVTKKCNEEDDQQ